MSAYGTFAKCRPGPEMSAVWGRPDNRGHHETDAFDPKQTWRNRLLDDLLGAGENRRRDGEAKRLRGLAIDHEFEPAQRRSAGTRKPLSKAVPLPPANGGLPTVGPGALCAIGRVHLALR